MKVDTAKVTSLARALKKAGAIAETPQEAAERIWDSTAHPSSHPRGSGPLAHDPLETMRLFEEWAREKPERILAVLTAPIWFRAVRAFLERGESVCGGWRHGWSFRTAMNRIGAQQKNEIERERERRKHWLSDTPLEDRSRQAESSRQARIRRKAGKKLVFAEVDVKTGALVKLIDKEYGPFAHIRINGLKLADVTTEEALRHCDDKTVDIRFIRELCQLIPDPRKPIGEQWTPEIIRAAKARATNMAAA